MTIQFLSGLNEIEPLYDAFIIDLWGVLHDGTKPYPQALETLKRLKDLNKTTLLLSNSPRLARASEVHLTSMGLTRDLYSHIYTSGEDTYDGLKSRPTPWHQKLGQRLFYLRRETYVPLFSTLPYEKVDSPDQADFILVTSADHPTIEVYEPILERGLKRGLPMLCANPDQVVVSGGHVILCCGSIAKRYEDMGGDVCYHGKPYASIYKTVLEYLKGIPLPRILAIGDSLTTDIKGANAQGIDTMLIMSGIHKESLLNDQATLKSLQMLSTSLSITPNYALTELTWE